MNDENEVKGEIYTLDGKTEFVDTFFKCPHCEKRINLFVSMKKWKGDDLDETEGMPDIEC